MAPPSDDAASSPPAWAGQDRSFLADPGTVADWRAVVLIDAAGTTGVLAGLPGAPDDVAERAGTDPHATRILLDALAVYGVVTAGGDGVYRRGPAAPDPDEAAVVNHHARALRSWSAGLQDRLEGREPAPSGPHDPGQLASWYRALGARARERAPAVVDACLAAAPGARTVLDVGGGHGEFALEFARRGLAATMQDLPEAVALAREAAVLPAAGVSLFDGDFFAALPDGPFDVVLLAGVAHTFPPQRVQELYGRLRPLVGGVLVVSTFLRGTAPRNALFAVQMLVNARGGDTHSEDEHREWLHRAGFERIDRVTAAPEEQPLLLAFPPATSQRGA